MEDDRPNTRARDSHVELQQALFRTRALLAELDQLFCESLKVRAKSQGLIERWRGMLDVDPNGTALPPSGPAPRPSI